MEKQYDVTALGELLIDFTDSGVSGQGNALFEANPGGAPCNVLAMLNKLGYKTAFIGKVGNDIFGNHLKGVLEGLKVDISGLVMDEECRTTLAFVKNQPDGDRDFSFYRNPGADMMLRAEEVREELSVEKLGKMLTFANAAASIITTRKGALRVMPERKEIEQLLLR